MNGGTNDFSCSACGDTFATMEELRVHCKSERHVYNTKRRLAGLKPISLDAWERKLREARLVASGSGGSAKGTSHIKAGKETKHSRKYSTEVEPSVATESVADTESAAAFEMPPPSPRRCLFDRRHFNTVEENVAYMRKKYSFNIPDQGSCTDVSGLLLFLHKKISEFPHNCLCCGKKFRNLQDCLKHMIDLAHTRIGQEAFTRTGRIDEDGTDELQTELSPFYDHSSSAADVMDRISDPRQKVGSLLRFFDADRDGHLCHEEIYELWKAATGDEFTETLYLGACKKTKSKPGRGLDEEALAQLYEEGFADLEIHYKMLREKIVEFLRARKLAAKPDTIEEEEDEDAEASNQEEVDSDEEEECSEEDDTEVLECEDEDEFQEVMRILGLQQVSITDTGDLRLPNGAVATSRDVQHIFKQRGKRFDQLSIVPGQSGSRPKVRSQLMLSNSGASGNMKLAISHRAHLREGKKVVAVLRRKQQWDMHMGLQHNKTFFQHRTKIRTGMGDASYGR